MILLKQVRLDPCSEVRTGRLQVHPMDHGKKPLELLAKTGGETKHGKNCSRIRVYQISGQISHFTHQDPG